MSDIEKKDLTFIDDKELGFKNQDSSKASPLQTLFNVTKTIIGGGLFATPYALNNSGFWFGIVLLFLLGFVFYYTIITLVKASVKADAKNIQDLVQRCFGINGLRALNIVLIVFGLGVQMAYTIIIADVMTPLLRQLVPSSTPVVEFIISRRGLLLIISLLILLPISLSRTMKGLAKFSTAGLAAIIIISISVLAVAPTLGEEYLGSTSEPVSFVNPSGIIGAINVFSFAYLCHHNLLLNFHSMRTQSIKTFQKVTFAALLTTGILTAGTGCAYLFFREKSQGNVLNNFPSNIASYEKYSNAIAIIIARLLFGLQTMFTYPLGLFVVRDTIEKSFFLSKDFSWMRHVIISLGIMTTTTVVGFLTCDLGLLIELTGGICGAILAFVVPSATFIKASSLSGEVLGRKDKILAFSCLVFGVFLIASTTITNILSAVSDGEDSSKECGW